MKTFKIPSYCLLIIFLGGCVKEVQVELPEHQPKIVVNSFLSNDDTIKIHVSSSAKQTDYLPNVLREAEVILASGSKTDTLVAKNDGWYHSKLIAKAGNEYSIRVNAKGYKSVYARDIIPYPIHFSIENFIARSGVNEFGFFNSSLDVIIEDDPNCINYYEISYRNHKSVRRIDNGIFNSGIWSETPGIKSEDTEGDQYLIFSDETFNGQKKQISIYYNYSNNIDSVSIFTKAVSFDYYCFKKSLTRHMQGQVSGDLWGGYDIYPLFSMIENGYGIFAAYAETEKSLYTYTKMKQ